MHSYSDLIRIFNTLFQKSYDTILVKGESEPIYLPKSSDRKYNEIIFANGFFSSGLHEISHWLVAGVERRNLEDFGYWYKPDGRTAEEQQIFESVEVKPQAIEWCLSQACQLNFNFSADNLSGEPTDMTNFKASVYKEVCRLFEEGFPKRLSLLIESLTDFYHSETHFTINSFKLD